MAGIREHRKAETRRAITEAAVRLFSDKGFDRTSIEDIARAAGIGKTTVYGYFATKDEIFLAYCDDELEESFASLQRDNLKQLSLIDQLVDFFMLKFRFMTQNHEFGRQLLREMVFPKEINEKAKEHDQRYFDMLESFFLAAIERGEIKPQQDMFLLSVHFFSLYLGALAGWYTGYVASHDEVEVAMRALFLQTLEGIAA